LDFFRLELWFEAHDKLPRRFDERRMNAYIVPGVSENRRAPTELFAFTSDRLQDGKFWQDLERPFAWSKTFFDGDAVRLCAGQLEAGKRRLAGDTARAATSGEVKDLRREATALKEVVADLTLETRLLKKSMNGDGRTRHGVSCGRHRSAINPRISLKVSTIDRRIVRFSPDSQLDSIYDRDTSFKWKP
jgi:hypothetical protein